MCSPAQVRVRAVYGARVADTDARHHRGDGDDTPLVLDELGDKLDAFWSLATADDADADKALEEFGARGRVEADMTDLPSRSFAGMTAVHHPRSPRRISTTAVTPLAPDGW